MAETQYVLSQTKQGKKEWIPLPTGGVAAHNQAWSTITDTPTTLAGYGITDGGSMEWPGAGIPLSTGASPWGTSYTTTGSGTIIALAAAPTFTGKVTASGDLDTGNATDGVSILLSGKNLTSYSYNLSTKLGDYLSILSNKAGAIPFRLDSDGGITSGKIDLSGAFGSTVKALTLRNTTTAASGNEITQNFYFKSSAWTNNLQAQLAVVTDGYSSSKLVYRSHDLAEGGADTLLDRFHITTSGSLKIDSAESLGVAYSTGFFGNGYKIIETGGETTAEFDNVIVRKLLKAYVMEVDRIDVIGGSLVISPASGTVYSVDGTNLYFDTNNNANPIQFKVDDYIGAQQWVNYDHTVIASYRGKVTAVHQSATLGSAYIETTTISGTAWAGMRLAQLGNSSDVTRQSLLYLTSADSNNPFIEAHTEVTGGVFTDNTRKFRLGNLTGVTDPVYGALSGYGLYSQNVYLTGWIKANSGLIGGWDINSTYLSKDTGTDESSSGLAPADFPFYAGKEYADRATAPFRVTNSGYVIATKFIHPYILSDEVIVHNNDPYNAVGIYTLTKVKEITLGNDLQSALTLRIAFTIRSVASGLAEGKIYRNGSAVGTLRTANTSGATFSEDIAGWVSGDVIELWVRHQDFGNYCVASNFRVLGSFLQDLNEVSGTATL